jgi:hypothetical protein
MHRFISQRTAALAALVITLSAFTATVTVPTPQLAATIAVPAVA